LKILEIWASGGSVPVIRDMLRKLIYYKSVDACLVVLIFNENEDNPYLLEP
jgi:hypothetical protein